MPPRGRNPWENREPYEFKLPDGYEFLTRRILNEIINGTTKSTLYIQMSYYPKDGYKETDPATIDNTDQFLLHQMDVSIRGENGAEGLRFCVNVKNSQTL
ncbi:hypothetical protein HYV12_01890 [Candidatus Dojkabacteria bacterium]|nr:hypothetical protein [Candidatus Dojkabacteria bacterium]